MLVPIPDARRGKTFQMSAPFRPAFSSICLLATALSVGSIVDSAIAIEPHTAVSHGILPTTQDRPQNRRPKHQDPKNHDQPEKSANENGNDTGTQGAADGNAKTDPSQDGQQPEKGTDSQDGKTGEPTAPIPVDDDVLFAPYVSNVGLLGRLEVSPAIRAMSEDQFVNRVLPRLTGERNRLILEVRNLVETLGDVRYAARVEAQRALIEKGPLILSILENLPPQDDLEIRIRLTRVKEELGKAGKEDIERNACIARGLAEALSYRSGPVEIDALLSAIDYLDSRVRLAALRSAGVQMHDPELAARSGAKLLERIQAMADSSDLEVRNGATTAIGAMQIPESRDWLLALVSDPKRSPSHRILALRLLHARKDIEGTLGEALAKLSDDEAEFLRTIAACLDPAQTNDRPSATVNLELEDGGKLEATHIVGLDGANVRFAGPKATGGSAIYVPRSTVDVIINPSNATIDAQGARIFLESGTSLRFDKLALDGDRVTFHALDRDLTIPKAMLRGVLSDASRGRILGGSRDHDQVRLREGEDRVIEGKLEALTEDSLTIKTGDKSREIAWKDVEALLFRLDGTGRATGDTGDIGQFVQVDMANGERLVGYLVDLDGSSIRIADRRIGCVDVALTDVARMHLSNSGRALTGFTLVCDFGNTSVMELDGEGRVVWKLEELFDPLDAEITPTGTILITEQADDAVREYDRGGKQIWAFTDLGNPMDADRLPNGNTLITDPGNNRVIEVDREKNIVWKFGLEEARRKEFKPYDADRLPNGNTLITDQGDKRVIEVTTSGEVVWEIKGIDYLVDADRLPNGNTLITRRSPNMVFEVNQQGATVWKLEKLTMPGDADRLPDGTTMVAEDGGVKIYGRDGTLLRRLPAEWAIEANGY